MNYKRKLKRSWKCFLKRKKKEKKRTRKRKKESEADNYVKIDDSCKKITFAQKDYFRIFFLISEKQ